MKILFLCPYPLNESPSQRFRFEQYFEILNQKGHTFHSQSFLDSSSWQIFYTSENYLRKLSVLVVGFLKRISILFSAPDYDIVFVHREITPVGPPLFEYVISRVLKKKIIYDYDDAIWMTDRINESSLLKVLKGRDKVSRIIGWSYRVSCGNDYLCAYARAFNENVCLIPTTIDTKRLHNPARYVKRFRPPGNITIGWTGSHSTLKYLEAIEGILQQVEQQFENVSFTVIADRVPKLDLRSLKFVRWNLQDEINELYQFDIGIMPLPDNEWSKGKCGFKALQYMALEIPTIASPVGVNTTIITHRVDGFLASSPKEWLDAFSELIRNVKLRKSIGEEARKTIEKRYSVDSNAEAFLALFAL